MNGNRNAINKSQSGTNNKRQRRRGKGGNSPKGKEMEVNIKDSSVNRADLPHVVTSAKSDNDVGWYKNISSVASDYGSIPFPVPLGNKISPIVAGAPIDAATPTIAGILSIKVAPTIGVCQSPTDPPNIAAQQIYTLDRAANSGAKNYDKTDVMMVVEGMDSAYMLYEEAVRAYKVLGTYNYMNRYMPDMLLETLGWSSQLANEMADFRAAINLFAYKLSSINIPDQFDFIHRHSWLFTNIYKDSPASRAQMYALVPDGYYVWTEGTEESPLTYLKYVQRPNIISSVYQFQTLVNQLMNPLLGSEDVGTISGDLAKAFGEGGMIKIGVVSDHEFIEPVYSMEVLAQISNATCYANRLPVDTWNITQVATDTTSGPYLVHQPMMSFGTTRVNTLASQINPYLNLPGDEQPSIDNTLVSTRLMSIIDSTGKVLSCGTELVTAATYWYFDATQTSQYVNIPTIYTDASGATTGSIMNNFAIWSKFDWAPTVYTFSVPASGNTLYEGTLMDANTFAILQQSDLTHLNDICIMSEYAVKSYHHNS